MRRRHARPCQRRSGSAPWWPRLPALRASPSPRPMRLGILVSGRGSNLEAVLDAIGSGQLLNVEPALVVANRPGIRALEVAARRGVPWRLLALDDFAHADARDAAIGRALVEAACDSVLLG